jgi:hypothetical protein
MRRVLGLMAFLAAVSLTAGSIDPAEFECEEAVAHIEACCDTKVNVTCGGTCVDVQLSLEDSKCLQAASCESLKKSGACEDPLSVGCK